MIDKQDLRKAKPEDLRRLAKFIDVKGVEEMSDKQLIKFLAWYYKRPTMRQRNMSTGYY
jgi:hypothetical protein